MDSYIKLNVKNANFLEGLHQILLEVIKSVLNRNPNKTKIRTERTANQMTDDLVCKMSYTIGKLKLNVTYEN